MDSCIENCLNLAKELQDYRKIFIALGDETRLQILTALLENEQIGMRVPSIARKTHLSRPAVSHHLRILKDAGLICMHRVGTRNYYYVAANQSCWHGLKELFNKVDAVVQMAAKAGYPVWNDDNM